MRFIMAAGKHAHPEPRMSGTLGWRSHFSGAFSGLWCFGYSQAGCCRENPEFHRDLRGPARKLALQGGEDLSERLRIGPARFDRLHGSLVLSPLLDLPGLVDARTVEGVFGADFTLLDG